MGGHFLPRVAHPHVINFVLFKSSGRQATDATSAVLASFYITFPFTTCSSIYRGFESEEQEHGFDKVSKPWKIPLK
jgi:hypothetical protein